jgi:hypothetical protein
MTAKKKDKPTDAGTPDPVDAIQNGGTPTLEERIGALEIRLHDLVKSNCLLEHTGR